MKNTVTIRIVILAIAVSFTTNGVKAGQVLNIGLTRFEAIPLDSAVRIEWDTETELGTAGYRLKRGQNGTFSYLLESGEEEPLSPMMRSLFLVPCLSRSAPRASRLLGAASLVRQGPRGRSAGRAAPYGPTKTVFSRSSCSPSE